MCRTEMMTMSIKMVVRSRDMGHEFVNMDLGRDRPASNFALVVIIIIINYKCSFLPARSASSTTGIIKKSNDSWQLRLPARSGSSTKGFLKQLR